MIKINHSFIRKSTILLGFFALTVACRHQQPERALSENEKYAIEKGHEAAERIIQMPKGSMQQEKAVLAARAQEQRIREAGDSAAAAAYAAAVEQKLDSAGVISRDRHN